MNICFVCLRTDRVIKVANEILKDFHEDLCKVPLETVKFSGHYCIECRYLLAKFYKFKQKCQRAQKIYQKWFDAKTGSNFQKHPENLHILLPKSSLGVCPLDSENVCDYTVQSKELQPDQTTDVELAKIKEVKVECDQIIYNDNTTFDDILKNEYVNVKLEPLELDGETEDRVILKNINEIVDNSDCSNSDNDEQYLSSLRISKAKLVTYKKVPQTKKNTRKNEQETPNSLKEMNKTLNKSTRKKTEKNEQETLVRKINEQGTSSKTLTDKKKAYFDKFKENDKVYGSVFEIEYLNTLRMKLEEFERRKTYEQYVKAKHRCEICYQVVKSSKFLEYHMNKWHNESKDSILCPICKTWNSKKSKHRRTHIVVFRCKMCPLVTYHRKSMRNHFEQHRGKLYHCEQCNITYKSNSSYRNHMGKAHREGRNVCEACGRGFNSPLGLKIHKSNSFRCTVAKNEGSSQVDAEGVRCDECDVTLPSQEVFDAHIRDVHEPKRKNRSLNNAEAPLAEIYPQKSRRRVRRAPEHKCRLCNKVGVSFGWLQLHFKKEHPDQDLELLYTDKRNLLCDVCGSGFSNIYGLRAHINIHTGARPHACDLCPKKFRSAYLLREHRVRHFPSSLPCNYCGKGFKTRANLYSHMKTHTGEKDHVCNICGKGFVQGVNLKEHIRGVHYNIRRVKRKGERGEEKTNKRRKTIPEAGGQDSDAN